MKHIFSIPFFYSFFVHTLYINATPSSYRYPINEHKGNIVNDIGIDFERDICIDYFETNKDVDDYVLPPNLLRLVEQKEKKILPHEELTEVMNLGCEKKRCQG